MLEAGDRAAATGDDEALARLNAEFHDLVAAGTGSKILGDLIRSVRNQARQLRGGRTGAPADSWPEHAAVIRAVLDADAEMAALLMRRHLVARHEAAVRDGAAPAPRPAAHPAAPPAPQPSPQAAPRPAVPPAGRPRRGRRARCPDRPSARRPLPGGQSFSKPKILAALPYSTASTVSSGRPRSSRIAAMFPEMLGSPGQSPPNTNLRASRPRSNRA